MAETKADGDRRVGVLIHLPRPLIEQLRADAERAGRSLSRELEWIVRQCDADSQRKEAAEKTVIM